MSDAEKLEEITRDFADRQGFFSRDWREYRIAENDMWKLCQHIIEAMSEKVAA